MVTINIVIQSVTKYIVARISDIVCCCTLYVLDSCYSYSVTLMTKVTFIGED